MNDCFDKDLKCRVTMEPGLLGTILLIVLTWLLISLLLMTKVAQFRERMIWSLRGESPSQMS